MLARIPEDGTNSLLTYLLEVWKKRWSMLSETETAEFSQHVIQEGIKSPKETVLLERLH